MPLPSKLDSGNAPILPSSTQPPVSDSDNVMSLVPVSVNYSRDRWIRDLHAIQICMRQDRALKDEFRWQHYHEVLLWYLVQAQSTDDLSFTMGSQYSWDRETLKSTSKHQPPGTPLDPKTSANLSTEVHPGTPEPRLNPSLISPSSSANRMTRVNEADDMVFNPASTSTPSNMWFSSINLEEELATPAHGTGTTVTFTTPDSPTTRLADRLRTSVESPKVQKHLNIGRERRTPDITFFVTRIGCDTSVNLAFVVVEIKPVANDTDNVYRTAFVAALSQACEQAQFVFAKPRERVDDLHLLVLVGETFMYGGSVRPQDFIHNPLPEEAIEDPKAHRRRLDVDEIAQQTPIYNIWADEKRTQFTPQFIDMYQTIFKGVKTQYGKVRS